MREMNLPGGWESGEDALRRALPLHMARIPGTSAFPTLVSTHAFRSRPILSLHRPRAVKSAPDVSSNTMSPTVCKIEVDSDLL